MLEYSLSSESSESSSSSPSRIGTVTLEVYASKFRDKLSKLVPVPYQQAIRRMTRRRAKLVLRRSFMALAKRHLRNKTLDGSFDSKKVIIDLWDMTVTLEDVVELPYTDIGGRKDKLQFVLMVKNEVFAGATLPDDVSYWLNLIAEQKDPWDLRLLGHHIYMVGSRQAYGMFMSFCSTIHALRKDKPLKYEDLKNSAIFDTYIGWDIVFWFSLLNDTRNYRNPETGLAVYDPNITGLIWLFRCCWQHPAQKFPHLMIAVMLGEQIPGLISDIQKAMFEFGMVHD